MAQSVTVPTVITRIRRAADIETNAQANSLYPDADLLDLINQGYRALFDLICEAVPEVGEAYFALSTTVGPSSWTVPAGFYRELGIDFAPLGITQDANAFDFVERNRNALVGLLVPKYRIINGTIVWRPTNSAPTSAVTLWYIPTPSDLASNGSFDAFNGWDDFIVYWVAAEIRLRQELDMSDVERRLGRAVERIERAAKRIVSYADSVVDVESYDDCVYYNS